MILIDVNKQSLIAKSFYVVEQSVKYLKIKFSFSPDWADYQKTAIFTAENGEAVELLLTEESPLYAKDGAYYVPHEVIKVPSFEVCLLGTKNESKITTESIKISVAQCGADEGNQPQEPTPSLYSQITDMCSQALDKAQEVLETEEKIEQTQTQANKDMLEARQLSILAQESSETAEECKTFCEEAKEDIAEKTQQNLEYSNVCAENAVITNNEKIICGEERKKCEQAKEQTLAAKLALEEGVEWVFDGGNATTAIQKTIPKIASGIGTVPQGTGTIEKQISFGEKFKSMPSVVLTKFHPTGAKMPEIIVKTINTTYFIVAIKREEETEATNGLFSWIAVGE